MFSSVLIVDRTKIDINYFDIKISKNTLDTMAANLLPKINAGADVFTSIVHLPALPDQDVTEDVRDVFDSLYGPVPSEEYTTYSDFMAGVSKSARDRDCEDDERFDVARLDTSIPNQDWREFYVIIDYPVEEDVVFKFTANRPLTYGLIFYAHLLAYQLMYQLEEEEVGHPGQIAPNILNRAQSEGPFQIWGHDLSDLVYNGDSLFEFHNSYVVGMFRCDS